MVERFYGPLTGFEMRPGKRGDYDLRYSDYAALEAENERLRTVVSKVCAALPNGAVCSPRATIDFMEHVPAEVAAVIAALDAENERLTKERDKLSVRLADFQEGYNNLWKEIKHLRKLREGREQQAVAWQDATGRELHKIILDHQKKDMLRSGGVQAERAAHYSVPLIVGGNHPAPQTDASGVRVNVTRTDILREWFGGERYARDYEYLDASFGHAADRVVTYLSTLQPDESADLTIAHAVGGTDDSSRCRWPDCDCYSTQGPHECRRAALSRPTERTVTEAMVEAAQNAYRLIGAQRNWQPSWPDDTAMREILTAALAQEGK